MKLVIGALGVGVSAIVFSLAACVGDDPAPLPDTNTDDAATASDTSAPVTDSASDAGVDAADAADAAPPRFCDTQAPLTGVANFFCADFDGTDVKQGWTIASVPDAGGMLTQNSDLFHSSPFSLSTSGGATLEYSSTAAANFSELDVSFQVNVGTLGGVTAPTTGDTRILQLSTPDTTISFDYAQGGSVGSTTNYDGYYLFATTCPSACEAFAVEIPTAPAANTWTNVSLVWAKDGTISVSYNNVLIVSKQAFFSVSSKVNVTLGLVAEGAAPLTPRHSFDDFIVSVRR